MHHTACRQAGPPRVDHLTGSGRLHRPSRARASCVAIQGTERNRKNAAPASTLRDVEAAQHRNRQGQTGRMDPCHRLIGFERATSVTRPGTENSNCVTACIRTSMMTLAAASGPDTAQNVKSRAPAICVRSNKASTASRTNLKRTAARSRMRRSKETATTNPIRRRKQFRLA
jgi:hypothetical protein